LNLIISRLTLIADILQKTIYKHDESIFTDFIKGHASCWSIQPYSRILSSTGDGNVFDIPPEVMINPPANIFGKGGTSRNTNYKMNISGNNAWVCHDEESTAIDGKKTFTTEFRILEKINGSWKLVAQSIHARKP